MGRPKKNKEVPLSEESRKLVEQGLKEAAEGKIERAEERETKEQDNYVEEARTIDPTPDVKKVVVNPEKKEKLNAVLRDINKLIGKGTVKYGNEMEARIRIPFAQKCLNDLTGGGIIKGLHTCIWGSKGCAKTTVLYDLIAKAQELGNQCVYINAERSYDSVYAKARKINTDTLAVVDVETLEEGLDIVIKLCRENVADLIIFDSIHGLAPKAELYAGKAEKEKSSADSNMALRARALTQYFEMGTAFMSKAKCAVVLVAQSRMDLGGFIKLETLTGGHALLHNSRLTLRFRRGQKADAPSEKRETGKITEKGKPETEDVVIGFDLVIHVDKSQIQNCVEGSETHVPFYFEKGIVE